MGAEKEKGVKQASEVSRSENILKEYLALLGDGKEREGKKAKGKRSCL